MNAPDLIRGVLHFLAEQPGIVAASLLRAIAELAEVPSDANHPDYEDQFEWVGGEPRDPAAFDLAEINERLADVPLR